MAGNYDWPRVAFRRAAIDAAAAVIITALLVVHYLRGNRDIDTSWVVLGGPVMLYHAVEVWRQGRAMRRGERYAYRAMLILTAIKVAAWLGFVIWAWGNIGPVVLGIIMLALKIGELGIYMRAGRAAQPEDKSGRA